MNHDGPRRRGRPAHVPTETTRALVADLVALDKSVADIAAALLLSEPTVRAHYAAELDAPRPQINFSFAESGQPRPPRRRQAERAGRPEHVPTDESRERVEVLIAGDMRQWQIAAALGISVPTLAEHYAAELEHGRSRKRAAVLEALYKAGVEGGNVAALKAWLAQPNALENEPSKPEKAAPLGKKDAKMMAAMTAAQNTDWASLLPN